jgi:hypothetical protein
VTPATGAAHLRQDLDKLLGGDPHSSIGHALRAELLIEASGKFTINSMRRGGVAAGN